jgi:mono/diheme cytochrome c family protein
MPAVFTIFAAAGLAALVSEPHAAAAAPQKSVGPPPLFVQKCAKCHGEDGRAQTEKGKKMHAQDFTDPDFQQHKKDEQLLDAITNGTEKDMPAFGKVLTPAEIESMLQVVRGFGR